MSAHRTPSPTRRPSRLRWPALTALAALSACTFGPDYARPTAPVSAAYKETDGWKLGQPQQAASNQPWWSIYHDPILDQLEAQIDISNQTLKAAEASYRQAEALVGETAAGYFPTVSVNPSATRSGGGGGSGSSNSGRSGGGVQNVFSLPASASWQIDVWGRIRREVESAVATAQASAADLAAARLSAQSTLATDYFELRVEDQLKRLLDDTIAGFQQSLRITQNQYEAGTVAQTDVITAQTQLQGTQAQAINVGIQRAQLEHAIAVLTGRPPAALSIAATPFNAAAPVAPPGVPSTLLERRPDIAAAERQVAAANATIGADIAAFFPTLTLTGSYGVESTMLNKLFSASSTVWSFGPQVAGTVFDAGLFPALAGARASYDQTVANYRQTVLSSFQQVEDELAALRILEQQAQVEDSAVRSAQQAVRLTLNQYQAGTLAYTSVVTAQATALADEESALTIAQNRLTASVALIVALGGGWTQSALPTAAQIQYVPAEPPPTGDNAATATAPSDASVWQRIKGLFP